MADATAPRPDALPPEPKRAPLLAALVRDAGGWIEPGADHDDGRALAAPTGAARTALLAWAVDAVVGADVPPLGTAPDDPRTRVRLAVHGKLRWLAAHGVLCDDGPTTARCLRALLSGAFSRAADAADLLLDMPALDPETLRTLVRRGPATAHVLSRVLDHPSLTPAAVRTALARAPWTLDTLRTLPPAVDRAFARLAAAGTPPRTLRWLRHRYFVVLARHERAPARALFRDVARGRPAADLPTIRAYWRALARHWPTAALGALRHLPTRARGAITRADFRPLLDHTDLGVRRRAVAALHRVDGR